ncbi:MAG: hypothetical protein K5784_00925 [Clostridiales bacterium]|nr:hypothetical protein [Clostridiales bacterium]
MKKLISVLLALLMVMALMPVTSADTTEHTHSWRQISRDEPTCTMGGRALYMCICGEKLVENLPALGHAFSKQVYISRADCTHYGVFYWECERCGERSATGNDKPMGHDWTDWVIIRRAFPGEEGVQLRKCSRCGETEKRSYAFDTGASDYMPRENGGSARDILDLLRGGASGTPEVGFGPFTAGEPGSGNVIPGEKLEISFMELNQAEEDGYLELDFGIKGGLPPYHVEVYYRGLTGENGEKYTEALAKARTIEDADILTNDCRFIVDAEYDFYYSSDNEWRQAHDRYRYKLVVRDSGGQEASADNYDESLFE